MRATLPLLPTLSSSLEKLRHRRIELILVGSMATSICLVSGTAFRVLTNPNLGQALTPVSLLKPGALQETSISAVGDALLQLSKPLRIEVVSSSSPSQTSKALTIVSPEAFQPQLLEQTHHVGIRLLLMFLVAGGALGVMVRFGSRLPIWPQRRRPLGERLHPKELSDHPLGVKRLEIPLLVQPTARVKRKVPAEALVESVFQPLTMSSERLSQTKPRMGKTSQTSVVITANVNLAPSSPVDLARVSEHHSGQGHVEPRQAIAEQSPQNRRTPVKRMQRQQGDDTAPRATAPQKRRILHVKPLPIQGEQAQSVQSTSSQPEPSGLLQELDLRRASPLQALL